MDRLKKAALLGRLIEKMREQDSWCGETHVQKAAYFLQQMLQVPLGYDFILYKHGPFSFDLRDELTAMRADNLIKLEPQWPYGPKLAITEQAVNIRQFFSITLNKYENQLSFIAEQIGCQGVAELERLATALLVMERLGHESTSNEKAKEINRLKPHISEEKATAALEAVDAMKQEADQLFNQ